MGRVEICSKIFHDYTKWCEGTTCICTVSNFSQIWCEASAVWEQPNQVGLSVLADASEFTVRILSWQQACTRLPTHIPHTSARKHRLAWNTYPSSWLTPTLPKPQINLRWIFLHLTRVRISVPGSVTLELLYLLMASMQSWWLQQASSLWMYTQTSERWSSWDRHSSETSSHMQLAPTRFSTR